MRKYLVDIYIPAAGQHLDAFIPSNKTIGEVTGLLVSAAEKLVAGSYPGAPGHQGRPVHSGKRPHLA